MNSSGEVKGIAKGRVTITVSAGKIKKKVSINVIVATSQIYMNSTYSVLKPDMTYQLTAKVFPTDAPQAVQYKTSDNDVISVGQNGEVKAKKCGSVSVIVSNEDTSVAVTVIVNQEVEQEPEGNGIEEEIISEEDFPNEISVEQYPVVYPEMLKYFYDNKKMLTVRGDQYTILIDGNEIVNYENEFYTGLSWVENGNGIEFVLNEGKKLCGEIMLRLDSNSTAGKYLYLYNQSKKKYERLQVDDIHMIILDIPGKYLITDTELLSARINKLAIGGGVGSVSIMICVYVILKKRYWFW